MTRKAKQNKAAIKSKLPFLVYIKHVYIWIFRRRRFVWHIAIITGYPLRFASLVCIYIQVSSGILTYAVMHAQTIFFWITIT